MAESNINDDGTKNTKSRCQAVIKNLKNHKSAFPFLEPVDPIALGLMDYMDIIREPMDLGTVEQKLKYDQYASVHELAQDIRKIWQNALIYNTPDSMISDMAKQMSDYFEQLFLEIQNLTF